MAIGTYAELQTALANWLERSDLTSRIPEFIALAEAAMNRELRVRRMLSRATATISNEYSAVPSDFLAVRTLVLDDAQLEFIDQADIAAMVTAITAAGKPTHYSVVGAEFRYYPRPDASYTAKLDYWAKIAALSASNTTNWLLTNHADAYLYAALLQAAVYLRDNDLLQVAGAGYTAALEAIRTADISETFGDRRRMRRRGFN